MKSSFKKIFGLTFMLSFLLLVLVEWIINQTIKVGHILGWVFVAISLAALIGILVKKGNSTNH